MKFDNINSLDERIEKIVKKNVHHYYSDWKHYDRPKYMRLKGSRKIEDKKLVLIVRNCGTYLLRLTDVLEEGSPANVIYNYYGECDSSAKFYFVDISGVGSRYDIIKHVYNAGVIKA